MFGTIAFIGDLNVSKIIIKATKDIKLTNSKFNIL